MSLPPRRGRRLQWILVAAALAVGVGWLAGYWWTHRNTVRYTTAKITFDQDKAEIDLDIATIASKTAALRAAQVNLAYTNIVSPVDGMVITRYIDVGQTVVSNLQSSTLFLIGKDMRKMQSPPGCRASSTRSTFKLEAPRP